MIRKVATIFAGAAVVVIAVAMAAYVALAAVNWRDREPSAAAVRLTASYREPPAVADADNAYVYSMGFHAPRDRDPLQVGLSRIAWLRSRSSAAWPAGNDPLPDSTTGGPRADTVLATCTGGEIDCVEQLDVSTAGFDAWVASDGWWLERYRKLLGRPVWREVISGTWSGPLPAYLPVTAAQRALLIDCAVLAERGDAAQVKALLSSDLRFWRMVLGSSDTVLSKMMAVGALQRHFEWGNLALRKLPRESAAAAVPDDWSTAFSSSERSLARVIAGEWRGASGRLQFLSQELAAKESLTHRVQTALFSNLYQPQDTLNHIADYYGRAGELLDTPLGAYPAALARASLLREDTAAEWR